MCLVDNWNDDEKNHGMAEGAVFEPAPLAQVAVFLDGQKVDVANITVLQLTGVAVVVAVNPRPVSVGDGAEEGADKADDVVNLAFLQEGIMAAVMLNNEDANQEEGD